jgi:hypothetical protein
VLRCAEFPTILLSKSGEVVTSSIPVVINDNGKESSIVHISGLLLFGLLGNSASTCVQTAAEFYVPISISFAFGRRHIDMVSSLFSCVI